MNAIANLFAGWSGFLVGAVSGAVIGLWFHRDEWLGGYGAFPRRMVRLGHIACFGLGLINILFALTAGNLPPARSLRWGSVALVIAMVAMPLTCFLTAWRKPFRHLFFIPVAAVSAGIAAVLIALP